MTGREYTGHSRPLERFGRNSAATAMQSAKTIKPMLTERPCLSRGDPSIPPDAFCFACAAAQLRRRTGDTRRASHGLRRLYTRPMASEHSRPCVSVLRTQYPVLRGAGPASQQVELSGD